MIYQIHRYPADMIDVVRLAGGERVGGRPGRAEGDVGRGGVRLSGGGRLVGRPVLPQDEERTVAFFRNLSGAARYNRFMSPMRELSPELLQRFPRGDHADHVALVAEVFQDGRETVIAEARYVRGADPSAAEFA